MRRFLQIALIGLALLNSTACSSKKQIDPNKERKFFTVAVRQLPPEPVYNRLTVAYLPEPLPSREIRRASFSRLSPVFEFEMKDATLEQTARILASMSRYTSYCSSVIASRKVSLTAVGTIDEIADLIKKKAGINVNVDHSNREVRFLANGGGSQAPIVAKSSGTPAASKRAGSVAPGHFSTNSAVSSKTPLKNYSASTVELEGVSGDVKVSDKTNGFLNNIKIEG